MLSDLLNLVFALIVLWLGAGLIVYSLDNIAQKLSISAFAASFSILGILTSIPEISVGINSIIEKKPEIYVGNLIGASVVLFLLVIPLLAILGNGVNLTHQLTPSKLILSLYTVGLPAFVIMDGNITLLESILLISIYFFLLYILEKKKGLFVNFKAKFEAGKSAVINDLSKIIVGAFIVYMASNILVEKTITFSQLLGVSPFILSLLGLSIGTNLPEITIALRAARSGKKEIALGDYIGSASANTVIIGILTLINRQTLYLQNHFLVTFAFTIIGITLFYYFTRSKNDISRKEGIILVAIYLAFILMELT